MSPGKQKLGTAWDAHSGGSTGEPDSRINMRTTEEVSYVTYHSKTVKGNLGKRAVIDAC